HATVMNAFEKTSNRTVRIAPTPSGKTSGPRTGGPRACGATSVPASLDRGDDDLGRLPQLTDEILAEAVAKHLADFLLDLLELRLLAGLAVGDEDQMEAEGRLHGVTHLAGLERERRLGERLDHAAGPREPVQVAAVLLRRARRVLLRHRSERVLQLLAPGRLLGARLGRGR